MTEKNPPFYAPFGESSGLNLLFSTSSFPCIAGTMIAKMVRIAKTINTKQIVRVNRIRTATGRFAGLTLQLVRVRPYSGEEERGKAPPDLFCPGWPGLPSCYGVTTPFSNRMTRSPLLRLEVRGQKTMVSVVTWPPAFRVPR
jgi:hypothetical protein